MSETDGFERGADRRETPLRFDFEGREIPAEAGQSVAGALHAAGVRTLSRSVKYHRPRGYSCGFGACGDCPVNIDGMPGAVSCTSPVRGGERVRREGGAPGVGFDALRTADLMRPFLKAGFQFRLFPRNPRLSRAAGAVMARLAGGGRMPTPAAAARATAAAVRLSEPEVLVIGAGVSGLTAALAAADTGAAVTLVDARFDGGRSRVRTEPVQTEHGPVSPAELVDGLFARARAHRGITFVRGTASGSLDGVVPVIDEAQRVRHELRPRAVVIAAGGYETPVPVPGHDLPGVMLADGALRLALIEGVRPGRRALVVGDEPRAAQVAERLTGCGVEVLDVVASDALVRVRGWSRARGAVVREASGRERRIAADLVCVAAERRPAEELVLQLAYAEAGSHDLIRSDTPSVVGAIAVGTAAGSADYSLPQIIDRVAEFTRSQTSEIPSTTQ